MDKLIKIGFSIFALAVIVFGFMRISNSLQLSFNTDGIDSAAVSEGLLEETKQKITDTDTDGLSDWDELNTYGTSPYLADSDSDGVGDSEELKASTDPNCPKGKDCGSGGGLTPSVSSPSLEENSDLVEVGEELLQQLDNLEPEEIREILKQGGATDEQLQGATDDDLRQLIRDAVQAQASN